MTESQKQLSDHIAALNAKTAAWVGQAPESRFGGQLVDDINFWGEMGITSVAEFDHYGLVTNVFESTRELMGYKPSWSMLMQSTDAELQDRLTQLGELYVAECESEIDHMAYDEKEAAYFAAMEAQEAWANPNDEIFFYNGCWN